MHDVIILGAGLVGASIAYQLSQAGRRVTVYEATRPAAGTSSRSFAWVNANEKLPRAYYDLNAAGLAEYGRLSDELPGDWFHRHGDLEWATDAAERAALRQKVARLRDWGYRSELVSREFISELEPDLALPPPGAADYAYQADDGWVEAPVLVGALLTAARRAGASLHWPAAVERLHLERGRVAGVVVAGQVESAALVIDCGGPAAGELLAPLGLQVARRRSPGLQVITEPTPIALARVVHAPGLYLRPDGGGRILLGSIDIDAELGDLAPTTAALDPADPRCQAVLRRGQAVLPWLAGARLVVARVGWRPMPADGLTAAGPIPGLAGYYLAFTHSGVTLGPLLGRLIASELTTGQAPALLTPFRPDRLTSGQWTVASGQ